ncbi:MAG: cytochrome c3 family protein [Planctomycetota bacterium]|nr:cytochrome c3 family protein [Planctomycetota bacterium]
MAFGLALTCWVACSSYVTNQGWDRSHGPVVPHDSFPADCALCHVSENWHTLRKDFKFDHLKQTGTPLNGAHAQATCLRCHNDRGPVQRFSAKGCSGCHTDIHRTRLGNQCQTCHTEQTWVPKDIIARHNRTRFPLTGGHVAVSCTSCHKGAAVGNFEPIDTQCASCHIQDYNRTAAPNHAAAGFTTQCETCHTPQDWRGKFAGHPSSFPLRGGHAALACSVCHKTGTFKGVSSDCVTCHLKNYQATSDPNHVAAGFDTTCQSCHNITSWLGAKFNHPPAFPLAAGHAGVRCSSCHTGATFKGVVNDCAACHLKKYQATTNPNHAAVGFSTSCKTCHTTTAWKGAKFNHPSTFPLTNGHAGVSCSSCHVGGMTTKLNTACVSCHQAKFDQTKNPPHAAAGFGSDCVTCHTTVAWASAKFTHTATFPLTNGHAGQTCTACHKGNVYKGLPSACVSCHQATYDATKNPNHKTSGFGTDCQTCHTTTRWQGANFKHPATFPLTAGHANKSCSVCHKGGVYTGLTTACASCHQSNFDQTKSPPHAAAGINTACQTCHTTTAWPGAKYTHTATFPLSGGHALPSCTTCHVGNVFKGLPNACVNCHQAKYDATKSPNHKTSGFGTDCKSCHNITAWQGATFKHPATFPLTASHANLACASCHKGGVYTGLTTACVSCHQAKYNATTAPPHAATGYGTDCKTCHNTTAWLGAKFTHPLAFPLTNGHAGKQCSVCHKGGIYTGLTASCVSCHQTKYTATTTPPHAAAGFSTACQTCHGTSSWLTASFTHIASFPLTAGHAGVACATCHKGNVFKGLPSSCVSCHQAKYTATTTPPHAAAGFNTACQTCHGTSSWLTASFTHIASFPLTAGHAGVACATCHKGNVYKGLPNTCVSCHQAKFNATTTPPHAAAGFATTCQTCHTTSSWLTASFTHIASFPLSGGHGGVACATCHKGNVFKGLPSDCASCHINKFNATTNPNHKTAGFGTNCATCHKGTTTWAGAVFNHSFPITTGTHKIFTCTDCHLTGNQSQFTCTNCHTHAKATTDSKHRQVRGYTWTSPACLSCHPRG